MDIKTFNSWLLGIIFGSIVTALCVVAAIETKTDRAWLAVVFAIVSCACTAWSATKCSVAYEKAAKPCDRSHKL